MSSVFKYPKIMQILLQWHSANMIDAWNQSYEEKRLFPWGITMRQDNDLIGTVILMPIRGTFEDAPRYPFTIAYDLKREFWNQGIMTEALEAVLDFSVKHIGPQRIQAEVVPENTASLRLLKKLGFQEEGILHRYLMHETTRTFLNVVMLALLVN